MSNTLSIKNFENQDPLPKIIAELALYPQDKWEEHAGSKSETIHGANQIIEEIYHEIEEKRWLDDMTTYLFCRTERLKQTKSDPNSLSAEYTYLPAPGLKTGVRIKHLCEYTNKEGSKSIMTQAPADRCRELAWIINHKTTTGEKKVVVILTFDPSQTIKVRNSNTEWEKCVEYWKAAIETQMLLKFDEKPTFLHAFTGIHEFMNIVKHNDQEGTPLSWKRHFISPQDTIAAANAGLDIYYSNNIASYTWATIEKQASRERARASLEQTICKKVILFDPIYGGSHGIKQDKEEQKINLLFSGETEAEKTAKAFWDSTITTAYLNGASDIHIEPIKTPGKNQCDLIISLRKDGQLNFHTKIPSELAHEYTRYALETSGVIKDKQEPQDGRRSWVYLKTKEAIDLRISITPVGAPIQKIVMRLLDTNKLKRGISDIGLEPEEARIWDKALALNQSLTLVSGSTGSGKCLPRETKIRTDKGILQIKEIVERHEKGERFKTWNEKGWENITKVYRCGKKEIVTVKTKNGNKIRAASTHPFLILNNLNKTWVKSENLKVGDNLAFHGNQPTLKKGDWNKYYFKGACKENKNANIKKRFTKKIPKSIWKATNFEIAGFISGWIDTDGQCKKNCIEIVTKKQERAKDLITLLAALGIRGKTTEKLVKSKIYYRINIKGKRNIKRLLNAEVIPTKKYKKEAILKQPKEFSTDKVSLSINNLGEINKKISSAIKEAYGKQKRKVYLKKFRLGGNNKKKISVDSLHRIFEEFPKALSFIPEIEYIIKNEIEPETVKGIIKTGEEEECFDIEVGTNHTYSIDGVICHNSTTLYAALISIFQRDNRRSFATIEDPVEYRLPFRSTQSPVNDEKGITYETLIRQAMRNDGDTFLIGEIRDAVTAKAAVQLALTGHQVLSSIHANSATETALRMLEFKVDPYILSETVKLIVAQKLVPTCCPSCKRIVTENEIGTLLRKYGGEILLETFNPIWEKKYRKRANWIQGDGCPRCSFTGLKGMTAAQEFLIIDDKNKKYFKEGNLEKLEESMKERSLLTMEETIWKYAWQGKIPIAQAGELTNQLKTA